VWATFSYPRLCALITDGMEASGVEQLVKQQIVENWESQGSSEHLRNIRELALFRGGIHILSRLQSVERLLRLYEQILYNDEIPADDSYEQQQLLLSGLVINSQRNLIVYNRIYPLIFNYKWIRNQVNWVEEQIALVKADEFNRMLSKRPYRTKIEEWLTNNRPESKLLAGKDLEEAIEWGKDKTLPSEDEEFINKSQKRNKQKIGSCSY
jgi:hypothetical protein